MQKYRILKYDEERSGGHQHKDQTTNEEMCV